MTVHTIPHVPAFERSEDAGSMAMLALEAALRALGVDRAAWWLAAVSGDAFKFVYDRAPVFEPLRDRVPLDTVTLASAAAGWRGHWRTGVPMAEVRGLVCDSVARGRPLLAPSVGGKWSHGMVIIVGVDEEKGEFLLQVPRQDPQASHEYARMPIPDGWNGSVPGPAIWADNPVYVFEGPVDAPEEHTVVEQALGRAIALHGGEPLPYLGHPGAEQYSRIPLAGRAAQQGLGALQALRDEVATAECVSFRLIWRLDAQCGQLAYDRTNAARFLRQVAPQHPSGHTLKSAADLYADTAEAAHSLQRAYWDKRWSQEADPRTLLGGIEGSSSFVHGVRGLDEEGQAWLRQVVPTLATPWGLAAVADGPRRRQHNVALAERIIANEGRCVELLRQAAT